MKNIIVICDPDVRTEIQDVPVPDYYNDDQILIKVIVSGSNPKDWKHPEPDYFNNRLNQGDDIAGTVEKLGKNVKGFSVGDRVAAFHQMDVEGGSFAEYAVAWKHTTFHIPEGVGYDEASTIPLAAYTAACGLFLNLQIPLPWQTQTDSIPLIVNGASSAVGAFAVKLAKLNPSIKPIIGIAGSSADYAKSIGCDAVLDYRSKTIGDDLKQALNGHECRYVFDSSNSTSSAKYLAPVLAKGGKYTCTQKMAPEAQDLLKAAKPSNIWVGAVHGTKVAIVDGHRAILPDDDPAGPDFGSMCTALFEKLLQEKRLQGHPYEVIPGGLDGVEGALRRLKARTSGNEKFVFRIADSYCLQNV